METTSSCAGGSRTTKAQNTQCVGKGTTSSHVEVNNKNRKYPIIDQQIVETYAKDSKATLNITLYDAYVRFFRWAIDRLEGRDGIVCFVSNNSFLNQITFDAMRKHLLQDFTQIYHIDLHGNIP